MFGFKKNTEKKIEPEFTDNYEQNGNEPKDLADILGVQENDTNITAGVDAILDESGDISEEQAGINQNTVDFGAIHPDDEPLDLDSYDEPIMQNSYEEPLAAASLEAPEVAPFDEPVPEPEPVFEAEPEPVVDEPAAEPEPVFEAEPEPVVDEPVTEPESVVEEPAAEPKSVVEAQNNAAAVVPAEPENAVPDIDNITAAPADDEIEDILSDEVGDLSLDDILGAEEDASLDDILQEETNTPEDNPIADLQDLAPANPVLEPEPEAEIAKPEDVILEEPEPAFSEEPQAEVMPEPEQEIAEPEDFVMAEPEPVFEEDSPTEPIEAQKFGVEPELEAEDVAPEPVAVPEFEPEPVVAPVVDEVVTETAEDVVAPEVPESGFIPAAPVAFVNVADETSAEAKQVEPKADLWTVEDMGILSASPKVINDNSGCVTWCGDKYQSDLKIAVDSFQTLKNWSLMIINEFSVPLVDVGSEVVIEKADNVVRYASLVRNGVEKLQIFNQRSYKFVTPQNEFFTVQGNVICGRIDNSFALNIRDYVTVALEDKVNKYIHFERPMSGFITGANGVRVFFANAKGVALTVAGVIPEPEVFEYQPPLKEFDTKACYVFDESSEDQEFTADNRKKILVVNVGASLYGWNVHFDNEAYMSLRDALEYQSRYKQLPSSNGELLHGARKLKFYGIEQLKTRVRVVYYSYGS